MRDCPVFVKYFHYPFYAELNKLRLAHLEALPIEWKNRKVLDVGCGVGDTTGFFIDKGCDVSALDARGENLAIFQMRYPALPTYQINLEAPPADFQEQFDIIFCYSLLHHLEAPAAGLAWLARRCKGVMALEVCVNPEDGETLTKVSENPESWDQSVSGSGCRPSREWVFNQLKKHFPHVYVPAYQPLHSQFPMDWSKVDSSKLHRALFIASTQPIDTPLLVPELPRKHVSLERLLNPPKPAKISLILSSNRPHILADKLEKWFTTAVHPQNMEALVVTDTFTPALVEAIERFQQEKHWEIRAYLNPKPGNLTAGWNYGASKANGDLFFQGIDEYTPRTNWDEEIREKLDTEKAQTLAVKDNFTGSSHYLNLAICTRRHYNNYGYLFHPSYQFFGATNEYSLTAQRAGAIVDGLDLIFNYSPIIDDLTLATAQSNDSPEGYDRFLLRKKMHFNRWVYPLMSQKDDMTEEMTVSSAPHYTEALQSACQTYLELEQRSNTEPVRFQSKKNTLYPLSVLLISTQKHPEHLAKIRQELKRQGADMLFEVLEHSDLTLSSYQQLNQLMPKACGKFVIAINDMIWPHPNTIADLLAAIQVNSDADLIVFDTLMTTNDQQLSLMGIDSGSGYDEDDWGFYRPPSHLMCWKQSVVVDIPFTETEQPVDSSWIETACQRVKNQVRLNKVLYFYNLMNNKTFKEHHQELFGQPELTPSL